MQNAPTIHRGINYSIRNLGRSEWFWEIYPPAEAVKGLELASGKVSGDATDAIRAAKRAIDLQAFAL